MMLTLTSKNREITERFVIRAKSMHATLRMAAEMTKAFYQSGPIVNRTIPLAWKEIWYDISGDFDKPHTADTWACVYYQGKPVFRDGTYHPFLDIIEQCDIKNRDEYDRAIPIAIETFQKAGQEVDIDHRVNIAAVVGVTETQTRCGLILRGANNTSTFNVSIRPKLKGDNAPPTPFDGLNLAATYLEGIELAYKTGAIRSKLKRHLIKSQSDEAQFEQAAYRRIGRLNKTVQQYETLYEIYYRPEKPEFIRLVNQAERAVVIDE